MNLLIMGLVLFVAVHAIPSVPRLREVMVNRLGLNTYKGLFAIVSFAGLGLIIWGKSRAPFIPIWEPVAWGHHATHLLVLVAFILVLAANMKTNIKRFTRHPMLWGVVSWGTGHLLINGDQASVLLFGGFVGFSIAAMISSNLRGAIKSTERFPIGRDLAVVAMGVALSAVVFYFHGNLFGYPLV